MDFNNYCNKCQNKKSCKAPCAFVEIILRDDNKVYERCFQDLIIAVSPSRQINKTSLYQISADNSDEEKHIDRLFSDDNETPFQDYEPDTIQTKIFIYRFFKGWKFKDIALKLDLRDEAEARKLYDRACNRVKMGLQILDERKKINHNAINATKKSKAFAQLEQGQKYYLLQSLFGMTTPEIGEMFGISGGSVKVSIQKIIKRIEQGKINPETIGTRAA